MAHFMTMFDPSKYVAAWELNGREVTLTIAKVERGEIQSERGSAKKAVITFKEAQKPFIANKTNCRVIASLYGTDTTKWVGQRITIYPTTTTAKGETVECIRVRNVAPPEKGAAQ